MDLEREKELVLRAKNEPQAFGLLYDAYYSQIYHYALKRTAAVAVALDVTSETFLNAFKNIEKYEWRGLPFSAWLFRIAAREVSNYYRQNGDRHLSIDGLAGFDIPDDEQGESQAQLEQQVDFLFVREVVAKLPPKYGEVIMLRYFDDLQLGEISKILGKREGTVKSLLHRGLARLRDMLKTDATFKRPDGF